MRTSMTRGVLVAFFGPDGTGKSTLADAVITALRPSFTSTTLFHWRPKVLPQINALLHGGKTSYTLADMSRPHRAKPSGELGSALRASYYCADYVIGYQTRIAPLLRRGGLVVFDRYFHDFLVDPERVRIKRGAAVLPLLERLVPKPDLCVVCWAPPEVLLARKQELPEEELVRQVAGYRAMASSMRACLEVDTRSPVAHCVRDIQEHVARYCALA
ncbi:MAG: hypothetical protein KC503_29680 [Myxococcales bacterium]|nr:hypothetical protein [Myxococcales bacterium]